MEAEWKLGGHLTQSLSTQDKEEAPDEMPGGTSVIKVSTGSESMLLLKPKANFPFIALKQFLSSVSWICSSETFLFSPSLCFTPDSLPPGFPT